ncbi:hypothetical protein FACUT_1356 [Fusarium acutatum]|uniref:Uncharacterized protein n=1 Tax=Fusarium acutatum TaxID=78861 RepID=A0A8H4NZQ4_9HYPO|nr:hypothetical protein FACUT_1356 [Fusarium acutatum]
MKLVTAIVSGGVGEIRQHEPKPSVSGESDTVASGKPESTAWLDVDDDDTTEKLEQGHITGASSFEICDETTLPSDYRVLPTMSGRDLECGLYALIESVRHQMPDGAGTTNLIGE